MTQIAMDRVVKRYPNGVEALRDVSLDFEAGQFVALLGPSGAGKSTLLRTINGLEPITAGSIRVDGLPVARKNLRSIRTRVGMVFQQNHLVPRLNVMTNVLTGRLAHVHPLLSLFHLFPAADIDLAHRALDRVGLVEKAWERADRLSGGQQQRVGIARALVQQPRAILADEPVASLDPATSREILDLLAGICRDEGITLLVNLHQVELARAYADRVVGLNRGRVVFDGPPGLLDDEAIRNLYGGSPASRDADEAPLAMADA